MTGVVTPRKVVWEPEESLDHETKARIVRRLLAEMFRNQLKNAWGGRLGAQRLLDAASCLLEDGCNERYIDVELPFTLEAF
ncbi:MAG: hypothetical protein F4210_13925 [Holophagales bacterium]|nr:hypothetical protein [Holophagales bacterium]MYF96579.1 hypothetical protein [Holophagales bacterium]